MNGRWLNPHQPQTLQIATFLLYFGAAFGVLNMLSGLFSVLFLLVIVAQVAAGYGIANEQKWGYHLGVLMAFFPFLARLALGVPILGGSVINLAFEIGMVALLLHPMSRDYQRVWFK